jgi:hypothetical protein
LPNQNKVVLPDSLTIFFLRGKVVVPVGATGGTFNGYSSVEEVVFQPASMRKPFPDA